MFVSYAWEDGALAEWLTLRLTGAGYRVWCDRFKLLGGECWPKDIDEAIRSGTFRMLQVVSARSLEKPNPTKERQLALALQREREEELFIPLKSDGTKPSDLNWQLSDITYIDFQNWGVGLRRLLKKLESVDAPRPLRDGGRHVVEAALLPPEVLIREPEELTSNWFPFVSIPEGILRFTTEVAESDSADAALLEAWPHRRGAGGVFYSLVVPPRAVAQSASLRAAGGTLWRYVDSIDGLPTSTLIIELLNKSILTRCHGLGLKHARGDDTVYFPKGLIPSERLRFASPSAEPSSRRTHVRLWGRRRSGASHFQYHLGFILRARRGAGRDIVAQLRLRLHVTDDGGQPVTTKRAFRRSMSVRRGWWNRQQLHRQTGIMEFLSGGSDRVSLWDEPGVDFALGARPLISTIQVRIDDASVALQRESDVDEPLAMGDE
ncbi:MAG: toll/interleukin-1 receptor domain-containing protein [bacterium]